MPQRLIRLFIFALCLPLGNLAFAQVQQAELIQKCLPFARIFSGADVEYEATANVVFAISDDEQKVSARINRNGPGCFELEVDQADYAVEIRRSPEAIALILPRHNVVYLGKGPLNSEDTLVPDQFLKRTCSSGTQMSMYLPLLSPEHPEALFPLLFKLTPPKFDAEQQCFRFGKDLSVDATSESPELRIFTEKFAVELGTGPAVPMRTLDDFGEMKVVSIDRDELESQLARGCSRALELLLPSSALLNPEQTEKQVPNGELRWIDGHRVVLLSGTPEEIGTAHGQLLQVEADRCLDSVMCVFGTLQTIRSGRWFRDDLREASKHLLPHIPERHRQETRALAVSLNLDPQLVEELNVFPELFHCSGFAVFGSATKDGKLYHGRVLDYMTMIGLQDAAVTFIIAADGQIPFANVGYAAFIGSVSGMNLEAISLGEMGGHGEGQWDGVPMATLMRRALEECSTLDEVMELWRTSPRTCEYYYVFADGKDRSAVGVVARPESIEFLHPGDAHPLLGPGIPDALTLSAGQRLQELRTRVTDNHGQIDADIAQRLMCRPVAMKSNLHNVLFVPEDRVMYVAQADHDTPAAERPYVRVDLQELVDSMTR